LGAGILLLLLLVGEFIFVLYCYLSILNHFEDLFFLLEKLLVGHDFESLKLLRIFIEEFVELEVIRLANELDVTDAHVIEWMKFVLSQKILKILFFLLDDALHDQQNSKF